MRRTLRTAAATAGTCLIIGTGLAHAGTIVDHDGETRDRTGAVTFTEPTVDYIPEDSIYGKALRVTWTVTNDSNVWVKSLGPGFNADGERYNDTEGQEMLVRCIDAAVPFAPGTVAHCEQYINVTDTDVAAGHTNRETPKFNVLYGLNNVKGEYEWATAEPVPAIDLATGKPITDHDHGTGDDPTENTPEPPENGGISGIITRILDALREFLGRISGGAFSS
ncbi:hypothetical protein [Corynebacterium pygosceleis]|uniref:Secreted protein n=1 Tax=Corynebacterium pygosceleis TaxID=2800406 RepID=A0A9Q4C9R4_9CORY|nr:hypothetical protein [Corynebacterium pygosceleis]MCK7636446.1 hypothetical protein [Corynebacterium pygosceleis]MCK7675019.1 hypothetical protein [Corynebacterium pygosceleis]MCL0121430.1 hypothetical protein [Corynebacterium pygosceleis]MCX7469240.1 hypothetical protein [Corynebacterium pygosceleis]